MSRRAVRPLDAFVSPDLELTTIQIELKKWGEQPVVKLVGRFITKLVRVGLDSQAIIETRYLTPAGVAFIEEMRAAFAGASARAEKEQHTQ